jgi:DNA polymerase I
MTGVRFLAHVIDPFGIEEPALVVARQGGESEIVTLDQLKEVKDTIVTYEISALINALRAGGHGLAPRIVEVRDALKLASGLSKDQGGERRWNTFRRLASVESGSYAKELGEMALGRRLQPERSELFELLKRASVALDALWQDLKLQLQEGGEWERFTEVEVPVQQIFWFRQYRGIALNHAALEEVRERTQKEKYDAFRKVAAMIGASPSTTNYRNIGRYLKGTDAEFLLEFVESSSIEGCFEAAAEYSEFAKAFVAFSQARKDESILLRIDPGQERMFPAFECFGTVTGRIIALNPALQSLRRRHRQVVAADLGKTLLYLDYAQFEPGILAQLSGDASFVAAYNRQDLYVELSRVLFGTALRRGDAKRIFLAYSYGMSTDAIARLTCKNDASAEELSVQKERVLGFFARFPGLGELRASLLNELQDKGSISSLMGNHRGRINKGRLSGKEQNWALSQRIQGSASLIFKDALIEISKTYGPDAILLPMHDAVLLQVPEADAVSWKAGLTDIMAACFNKWCPDIAVRVSSDDFALGAAPLLQ